MTHEGPYIVETTMHPNPGMHNARHGWREADCCGEPLSWETPSAAIAYAKRYVADGGSARVMGNKWYDDCGWECIIIWSGMRRAFADTEIVDCR